MKGNVIKFLGKVNSVSDLISVKYVSKSHDMMFQIWNSKVQAQGEGTSKRTGESKEEWRDFPPEITVEYLSYISDSRTGTENLKNQDTILDITSGVLHFVAQKLPAQTTTKISYSDGSRKGKYLLSTNAVCAYTKGFPCSPPSKMPTPMVDQTCGTVIFLFLELNRFGIYASIGGLDSCDVYSSDPSKFYYDGDDLTHKHSHGEENP
uniref:Uncharacterized protein n=1 Tax=Solanum lycopersicum TaxID=4081 RepID=A0A3Q7FDB1_SOLLC